MQAKGDPVDEYDGPIDFGDDAKPPQSEVDTAFARLDRLVVLSAEAADNVERCEAALTEAKRVQKQIDEREIPELMVDTMKQTKAITRSGYEVKVTETVRAAFPPADDPDRRAAALAWLIANGHGGIVKNTIKVDLDRGEDERASDLVVSLIAQGYEVLNDKTVASNTLGKLVRELLESGKPVERGLLGVFNHRTAKVKKV